MRLLYTLLLFSFTLSAQLVGDKQTGLASYYSSEYDGAETAYGTIYNKNELVAAHKAYPFNSRVSVRNQDNGKTVTVRIIDKGPFIRGRIIELSERAAREIGMLGQRTASVEITLLSTDDRAQIVAPPVILQPTAAPAPPPEPLPEPLRPVRPADEAPAEPQPQPQPTSVKPEIRTPRPAQFSPGTYKIQLLEPAGGRFAVQVASLSELERALDKVTELQGKYFEDILLQKVNASTGFTYKVLLGPFRDRSSAERYAADLKKRYGIAGFPVDLGPKFP